MVVYLRSQPTKRSGRYFAAAVRDDENRAPEETWSVNLAYVNELGKGTLFSNVGVKYAGRQLLVNTGAGIDNRTYQDGYHLVDARVAYELP